MDKKQQIKIPSYIWIIAAILVACIIFLIFVQVPFSQRYPEYERNHNSAAAQIQTYESYRARADEVQASIDKMKKQYEEESAKLFVNAKTTAEDIRKMLKKLDYDLSTLSVEEGVTDSQGRTSSTGDPLYSTVINFTFTASYQKMLETLDYFETQSDGSYYISNMTINIAEENGQKSTASATTADYSVTLTMNLYYFKVDTSTTSSVAGTSDASSVSSAA